MTYKQNFLCLGYFQFLKRNNWTIHTQWSLTLILIKLIPNSNSIDLYFHKSFFKKTKIKKEKLFWSFVNLHHAYSC